MARRLGTFLPWLFLLPLIAWIAIPGQADDHAAIDDLRVEVDGYRLLASWHLDHVFDDDYRRRLRSGLPTELIYHFELSRDRRTWFDKSVARGSLQVVAMYNATTDEYLVNFKQDGSLVDSKVVREIGEVEAVMTRLEGFPVFNLAERGGLANGGERLELRVRAELGTKTWLAFIPRTLQTPWSKSERFGLAGDSDRGPDAGTQSRSGGAAGRSS